jgi:hypothetical protein
MVLRARWSRSLMTEFCGGHAADVTEKVWPLALGQPTTLKELES